MDTVDNREDILDISRVGEKASTAGIVGKRGTHFAVLHFFRFTSFPAGY